MKWKKIKDFANYSVSDTGEVKNNITNKQLKKYERKGYCAVYLYSNRNRKFRLIHRLVASAFLENPNNYPQINHKDENPKNNHVENLEWCSPKYNSNYGSHRDKLRKRMIENNPFAGKKHSEESKEKMRKAKLGKPSKRKRAVIIDGIQYPSITEAMQKLKISTKKIYKIIGEN